MPSSLDPAAAPGRRLRHRFHHRPAGASPDRVRPRQPARKFEAPFTRRGTSGGISLSIHPEGGVRPNPAKQGRLFRLHTNPGRGLDLKFLKTR
jgi:hypothetical protein